jgi:hypothetical protein
MEGSFFSAEQITGSAISPMGSNLLASCICQFLKEDFTSRRMLEIYSQEKGVKGIL